MDNAHSLQAGKQGKESGGQARFQESPLPRFLSDQGFFVLDGVFTCLGDERIIEGSDECLGRGSSKNPPEQMPFEQPAAACAPSSDCSPRQCLLSQTEPRRQSPRPPAAGRPKGHDVLPPHSRQGHRLDPPTNPSPLTRLRPSGLAPSVAPKPCLHSTNLRRIRVHPNLRICRCCDWCESEPVSWGNSFGNRQLDGYKSVPISWLSRHKSTRGPVGTLNPVYYRQPRD